MSEITVSLDNRVRLVTAVLAASQWPQQEQAQMTHAVHPHSKQTRYFVSPFSHHPAVVELNQSLSQGVSLTDFFTTAVRCQWPGFQPDEPLPATQIDAGWPAALADFCTQTGIEGFWAEHGADWEVAYTDLTTIFQQSQLAAFLRQLLGPQGVKPVTIVPTIVYPMLEPVLVDTASTLFLILPPAKAWGESPPWPFGEDPGWVIAQSCWHLVHHFLTHAPTPLDPAARRLLTYAAVTLCLEAEFDEAEAMAYLVRIKKEQQLPTLPLVVEKVRQCLTRETDQTLWDLDLRFLGFSP